MSSHETILYAAYGGNRDPVMMEAMIGRIPKSLGTIAIQDVELCIQKLEQTPTDVPTGSPAPVSAHELLANTWGEKSGFETYTIRAAEGSAVAGVLYELSPQERALVAEWEMIEYGWYERMDVTVQLDDGTILQAETEGLREGHPVDRVVNGINYPTYLNDPEDMHRIAAGVREDYLAEQQ